MMSAHIPPKQFSQIMALPTHLRRDLLEFLGYASVAEDELDKIITDLKTRVKAPSFDKPH